MSSPNPSPPAWGHTAFLLLLIAAFASTLPALQALYLGVAFVVVVARQEVLRLSGDLQRVLAGLMVLTVTVMLPLSVLRGPPAVVHYGVTLLSMAAALVLTRDRARYLVASRHSLLAVQAGVFAYLFVHGFDDFPLENMIFDSSSNGITSYLIVLQANYAVFNFLLRRRASLATSILTLIICIVGYGRGSILASLVIIVINLLALIPGRGVASALRRTATIALLVAATVLLYSEEISLFFESNTKLGSGLVDLARQRILEDYLGQIDAVTLFTGAGYGGTSIVTEFRGNPHNSYIRAHHVFGMPYLLALALFPLALLWVRQPWTVKLFCAGMMVTVLFRASTEPILFPTVFDFYFFAFCFALMRPVAAVPAAPAPAALPDGAAHA